MASAPPVQWAITELRDALKGRGLANQRFVVRGGFAGPPESFSLSMEKGTLAASGADVRGLVYALLEAADRVRLAGALHLPEPFTEKPANSIRCISRCFDSDVEDKSWFHDRAFWRAYLTMLAAQRFNRFSLTLRLRATTRRAASPTPTSISPIPFLLAVPGYNVRAVACPTPSAIAIWKCSSSSARRPRARLAVPVGPLDARLPMGQQPACRITPSRA